MTKILSEIAYDMTKELYMINPKPNIQTRYNKAKTDTIKNRQMQISTK